MSGVVESRMFKSVPGGYIFQLPPPTNFHRTQAYLVNETQKAEIAAIAGGGLGVRSLIVCLIAVSLAVAAGVLIDLGGGVPIWASVLFGVCIWVVAFVGGVALVFHLKQRQLQPLLAGLPHSDERLFPEVDRAHLLFGPPSSLQYAVIWCGVYAFLLGQRFEQHPPFADVLSTVYLAALALGLFWAIRGVRATAPSPLTQVEPAGGDADQIIQRLTSRLERVEGQLKGLQFMVPVFALLLGIQLATPSLISTKTVVAESFGVKNAMGNMVARLGTSPDGTPSIGFFDAQQKLRLMAGLLPNGTPSIGFSDAEQKVRLTAGLRPNGGPSLSLLDPQQSARAILSLNDQHDPSLTLFNAEKLPRGVFSTDGADTGNSGHLIIYGAGGGLNLSAYEGQVRWNPRGGAPLDFVPVKK